MEKSALRVARHVARMDVGILQKQNLSGAGRDVGDLDSGLRRDFIERRPRPERYAWFKEALGRKVNEGIAAHLLQIWLVGQHSQVLCDFLDSLGIKHDENGTVEELPPPPAREQLEQAINALL